ncbi:MAG: AAA family ATPase [Verrucomicrobiota bacterium]|jgi:energy-coupling factor transporter ATP-binding protein EcfA2
MFRVLASDDFPPFGKFWMEFPPVENKPAELAEVHLFTGVNGTGKTRLLALLAAVLKGDSASKKRLKGATDGIGVFASRRLHAAGPGESQWQRSKTHKEYMVFFDQDSAFQKWVGEVPAFAYDGTAYVSDAPIAVMAGVPRPDRADCLSFSRTGDHSAVLLQAVANLKMQSAMDMMNESAGRGVTRAAQLVRAVEDVLTKITGQQFLFNVTAYPQPALQVNWANVEMPFDLLPDGLRSIIGWMVDAVVMMDAWLQGKGPLEETEAVFLLDEVEGHLHPVWQRRVLPAFQRLFSKAQIFVATHSPFVISSLGHGWIHPLILEKDGKVKIKEPVPAKAGESYISVIEDIMGLEEWYDPETEKLLAEFRAERDRAYQGDAEAKGKAVRLAEGLSARSMELRYMMGKELSQMERRLAKAGAK